MTETVPFTSEQPTTSKNRLRKLTATVALLGSLAALTSCGKTEPSQPTLACEVHTFTGLEGDTPAQVTTDDGSDFSKLRYPDKEVKDIVVTFNDRNADGSSNEVHTKLGDEFRHQFAFYRGLTHRIMADVIPVEGSEFQAGHCETEFRFSNAPVPTF